MKRIQGKDRRKFLRLKVYHLVKYKVIFKDQPSRPFLLAAIKDIGAGGICLKTEEALPKSAILELQINFPNLSQPIYTLGRVVWIKQRSKLNRYEIGVEFTQIEESLRKLIDKDVQFVYKKLNKREPKKGY